MHARLADIGFAGLGGALGSSLRAGLSLVALQFLDTSLLWATLVANLFGAALIGWLSVRPFGSRAQAFWMTGFCGGLTTFSMVSVEVLVFATRQDWALVGSYMAVSLCGAVLAVVIGRHLGRSDASLP
jgi:CrcB protein